MKSKVGLTEVQIIALGLLGLYVSTILIYLPTVTRYASASLVCVLLALYFVLVIGSVGLYLQREWGRKMVVWANYVTALFSLKLYFDSPDFIPMTYIFMNVIIPLFYNQNSMRIKFSTGKQINWKSVLIIDDDEGVIKVLRPILMTNGYAVLTAMTGEDGIQIAQHQKPDLIILDVILPGIKGRDACKKLKEDTRTKNIPIVFLTAKDSQDDIKAEKEAGAVAHLTKPINAKELVAAISSILG